LTLERYLKNDLHFFVDISVSDFIFWNRQEAVNLSLANLVTFPFIRERLESGRLQIYGMHYDFVKGELTSWRIEQTHKLTGVGI